MWLRFEGLDGILYLEGADALMPVLEAVLCGWRMREADGADHADIRISAGPGGYARSSIWLDGGQVLLHDPVDAVCDLLLDLEKGYVAGTEKLLALHAAAVEYPDGLVVFPSTHNSGKSLLTCVLAEGGRKVFADDVLPLEPDGLMGVSLGILPRVRMPLPDDLSPALQAFFKMRRGPASARFAYVALKDAEQAKLGTRAHIQALVLLDRKEGAQAELSDATEADVLKRTILQSFGRQVPALAILDELHAIVKNARCFHLTYGRAEDARDVLEKTFART